METNKLCSNCHQPLDPGATFCGNCGQPVKQEATEATKQPQVILPGSTVAPAPHHLDHVINKAVMNPEPPKPEINQVVTSSDNEKKPSYATAAPASGGEKKSMIGLMLGVIGIPAALIPILGLILGIAGLILGTTSRARYKHTLNLLAIIFSLIAILLSLILFAKNISDNQKPKSNPANLPLVSINTACYKVQIDGGLNRYKPKGCGFDSANSSEEFEVVAVKNKNITATNLAQAGSESLALAAKHSKGSISGGRIGTFVGSPAYLANYVAPKNQTNGVFAFVLHASPSGDNIFIIGRAETGGRIPTFGPIESTWVWR